MKLTSIAILALLLTPGATARSATQDVLTNRTVEQVIPKDGATARPATPEVLTVAVFDFESKDEAVRDLGPKVASLINAQLSADPNVITVERAELEKALGEQELGLSGTIQPETAAKVGHLTGAKVLVTGRVFTVGRETMIVAKVIGTETSRVYGEVVRGDARSSSAADMSADMATRIGKLVEARADTLVAKVEKPEDLVARLQTQVKDKKLPSVSVIVAEHHVGAPIIDPAAETEISFILQKLGFTLADKKDPAFKADVEITGEAFSEFGMRKGNLVSCKGRVELKAIQRDSGRVLFIDRQTAVAVELSEHLAGKAALQDAAAKLTERLLPKLVAR